MILPLVVVAFEHIYAHGICLSPHTTGALKPRCFPPSLLPRQAVEAIVFPPIFLLASKVNFKPILPSQEVN